MVFWYDSANHNQDAHEFTQEEVNRFQQAGYFLDPVTGKKVPEFASKFYMMLRATPYAKSILVG